MEKTRRDLWIIAGLYFSAIIVYLSALVVAVPCIALSGCTMLDVIPVILNCAAALSLWLVTLELLRQKRHGS